jgi:hypothetical protein
MPNQFYAPVPQIDFSGLGDLPKQYREGRQQAARDQTLAQLGSGSGAMDYSNAARALLAAGDMQGATTLAQLGNGDRDFQFRKDEAQRSQGNSDRSFGLQEKQFAQTGSRDARDFAFKQEEAKRSQANSDRDYSFKENTPTILPPGSGVMNKKGEIIREPTTDGLLDPETVTAMAQQLKAGDTSVLTNLGRGAQGAQNVIAVRKKVAELNAAQGEGGAEQANRNAEFIGVKSGQRTLSTKQANIEMAATEFEQVLPVVQKASAAVSRTNYPDLNKIIQSFETRTGDPAIVAFGGAVNTLVNLYSRAISPNGTPTVADKEHAREILGKAWSQGQFDAAVGMMKQEIGAALQSPEKVRDEMRKRFIGGQGGAPAPTTNAPAAAQSNSPAPPPGFQLVK